MIIERTSPYGDNDGNVVDRRVLVDVLRREIIAREAGEGRAWIYDEGGGSHLINMGLNAFREAYEEATKNEKIGI